MAKKKLKKSDYSFLYLLIVSFVFISTSALHLSKSSVLNKEQNIKTNLLSPLGIGNIISLGKYPSLPRKKVGSQPPLISAQSVFAVDIDSGISLFEKNPDLKVLPASTTKIMTALVSMDYYKDEDVLEVSNIKVDGQKMALKVGEKITAKNLLDGLLIFSANDAAAVLSFNYPGGQTAFVGAMNQKANKLGLTNTYFSNPQGFDNHLQFSTARDMVTLSLFAMGNGRFSEKVGVKEKVVTSFDGKIAHKLISTNKLLNEVPGVLGVKTGWTENAKENLVTYVDKDGHKVIISLLGSMDRFGETKKILEWIIGNFTWTDIRFLF